MSKPRIIAFYLPQYHPTPHNDIWWGKGFTEWTNVGKAKPLFPGHYQPRIPADLGYYDLRVPEVREQQAALAKEAGVEGFCYYHYWFANGQEELDLPFKEVVSSGKPDFPFCLCWANQSWENKMWDKNGAVIDKKTLIEQKYLGEEDNEAHFYSLLSAFKDHRYMTIDGRPIFMIYQPLIFEGLKAFMEQWNKLALENGLKEFYFIGQCGEETEVPAILNMGFDAVNYSRLFAVPKPNITNRVYRKLFNAPRVVEYKEAITCFNHPIYRDDRVFPVIIPGWDHTPRSGRQGLVYTHSTPSLFKKHVIETLRTTGEKENNIIFLKSWNEWGEGNYMEPDLKFGKGYIEALAQAISEFNEK